MTKIVKCKAGEVKWNDRAIEIIYKTVQSNLSAWVLGRSKAKARSDLLLGAELRFFPTLYRISTMQEWKKKMKRKEKKKEKFILLEFVERVAR